MDGMIHYLHMSELDYSVSLDGVMIGKQVRRLRESKRLSRDQLGSLVAQKNNLPKPMTGSYIYRLEVGRHPHPTHRSIELLARALEVPLSELIDPTAARHIREENEGLSREEYIRKLVYNLYSGEEANIIYKLILNADAAPREIQEDIAQYAERLAQLQAFQRATREEKPLAD